MVTRIAEGTLTVPDGFRLVLAYGLTHDLTLTQIGDTCYKLHVLLGEEDWRDPSPT